MNPPKKQWAIASTKVDELNIVEDGKHFLKAWATIVRAGVYDYPAGVALKPAKELLKAVRSARYAKLVMGHHPDTVVVMAQDQIFGGVEKPFWERNRMRALLSFDKRVTPPAFLNRVREAARGIGKMLNASIGFYHERDFTPGVGPDVNTGKNRPYDFVMRKIVIDHVAVGDFKGRCRAPQCGLGFGIDSVFAIKFFGTAKVVKRGEKWCILHTHGANAGKIIKGSCHTNKAETEAMHRAIEAQKQSAGSLSVSNQKGGKNMSENQTVDGEYEKCIKDRKAEDMTDAEAAEACKALKPVEGAQETPYAKCKREKVADGKTDAEAADLCKEFKTDQEEELTPWQACVKKHTDKDVPIAEAINLCKKDGIVQTDEEVNEEVTRQACIKGKQEIDGMTLEEATEACTPTPDADQEGLESEEVLPTPLEQCTANRVDTMGESEEVAKQWCKDELAGLHKPTEEIVGDIKELEERERRLNSRRG